MCPFELGPRVAGDTELKRLAERAKKPSPLASPSSLRRASRAVRLNVSNAGLANKLKYIADQGGEQGFW